MNLRDESKLRFIPFFFAKKKEMCYTQYVTRQVYSQSKHKVEGRN